MQKYCLERTICNIGCPERQLAEKLSGLSICKNLKIQFLVQLFDNGPMIQLWLDYCTSFLRFLTLGSLTGILPVDSWALFRYRSVKAGFEDSSWISPDQVQNNLMILTFFFSFYCRRFKETYLASTFGPHGPFSRTRNKGTIFQRSQKLKIA